MVRLVTVCSMISFLEIKRYQSFVVVKRPLMLSLFLYPYCIDVSMYLYFTQSQFLCDFQCIFASRASIICIDSGTCDTIRVSLALAIRFFDISINRYTLSNCTCVNKHYVMLCYVMLCYPFHWNTKDKRHIAHPWYWVSVRSNANLWGYIIGTFWKFKFNLSIYYIKGSVCSQDNNFLVIH